MHRIKHKKYSQKARVLVRKHYRHPRFTFKSKPGSVKTNKKQKRTPVDKKTGFSKKVITAAKKSKNTNWDWWN